MEKCFKVLYKVCFFQYFELNIEFIKVLRYYSIYLYIYGYKYFGCKVLKKLVIVFVLFVKGNNLGFEII